MKNVVTIHTFYNLFEAQLVLGRLQNEGIRAFVQDQHLNYTFGPVLTEGYRLQVEREEVLRAKLIVEKFLEDSIE